MEKGMLKITGNGTIVPGEYSTIKIMGNAESTGLVKAETIKIMGNARFEGKLEVGSLSVRGDAVFSEEVHAETINVKGNLKAKKQWEVGKLTVNGNCELEELSESTQVMVRGNLIMKELLRGQNITVLGKFQCLKDITCEEINVRGAIKCDGLLNAENVCIRTYSNSYCNEIGATTIHLVRPNVFSRMFSFPKRNRFHSNTIEGDSIVLERVAVDNVRGTTITLRKKCKVKRVEYTDSFKVSSNSYVEKSVKLGEA